MREDPMVDAYKLRLRRFWTVRGWYGTGGRNVGRLVFRCTACKSRRVRSREAGDGEEMEVRNKLYG